MVPNGVTMTVAMGPANAPIMSYEYTVQDHPDAESVAPTFTQWINSTSFTSNQIFINTGRRPLYHFNYLYNGQCGQVAFKKLP
jgi:hypothetical protein